MPLGPAEGAEPQKARGKRSAPVRAACAVCVAAACVSARPRWRAGAPPPAPPPRRRVPDVRWRARFLPLPQVDFEEALLSVAKRAKAQPRAAEQAVAVLQPTIDDKFRRCMENTNPAIERKVRGRRGCGRGRGKKARRAAGWSRWLRGVQ